MSDLKLNKNADGSFDLSIKNGKLETIKGFDTLLGVALFTDARAGKSQVLTAKHRRGWVGNISNPVLNRQLGGLLWLLDQRRNNQETLNLAVDYAKKSLDFIVKDGLAVDISVTGKIVPISGIELNIKIKTNRGITEKTFKLWEVTGT